LALKARADDTADLICFGRAFIGNPDLVDRLRRNAPLTDAAKDTWYGGDAHGYTDYPTMNAA
jgi:N-ethylmaleimide reductase